VTRRSIARHRTRHAAIGFLLSIALTLVVTSLAFAHAVVYPRASKVGAYEKYVLRVPNEKAVATLRVEIHFPAGLRVTSFADVAGWQLEVLTDSAKRIVGAVWTGTLPPQRFAEFPFVAANPKAASKLVWPTYQSYADGERVEWTGAEGSKSPASITDVTTSGDAAAGSSTRVITWLALAMAVLALALAVRRPDPRAVQ